MSGMVTQVNALHMGKQKKVKSSGLFPVLIGHFAPKPYERELFQKEETKCWMEYP